VNIREIVDDICKSHRRPTRKELELVISEVAKKEWYEDLPTGMSFDLPVTERNVMGWCGLMKMYFDAVDRYGRDHDFTTMLQTEVYGATASLLQRTA